MDIPDAIANLGHSIEALASYTPETLESRVGKVVADLNESLFIAILSPKIESYMFAHEISSFMVCGYTPEFNDGEPCEHEYEVPYSQQEVDELYAPGIQTFMDHSLSEIKIEECDYRGEKYQHIRTLARVINAYAHPMFGTNWVLLFEYNNDTLRMYRGEYDCGH